MEGRLMAPADAGPQPDVDGGGTAGVRQARHGLRRCCDYAVRKIPAANRRSDVQPVIVYPRSAGRPTERRGCPGDPRAGNRTGQIRAVIDGGDEDVVDWGEPGASNECPETYVERLPIVGQGSHRFREGGGCAARKT